MSISSVGSSPVLQWLQSYLAGGGSSKSTVSSCDCQASADTTSISKEATELSANQASQPVDPSQAEGVARGQGHHRHHRHEAGGEGSFMDRLAQSIITDLQQATGNSASTPAGSSNSDSDSSAASGGSFIDKLASEIAKDLLSKYQQVAGSSASSSSPTSSQVNTIA